MSPFDKTKLVFFPLFSVVILSKAKWLLAEAVHLFYRHESSMNFFI